MVTAIEYRRAIDRLSDRALLELAALLNSIGSTDPAVVRRALIEYLPDLVIPYMQIAAETAGTWYEDERAVTGVSGALRTAPLPDAGRYDSLARWGVRPLDDHSESTVLTLVGGGVQRMIADAGRDTIDLNAQADAGRGEIAATAWRRRARPDACEFCRMLAGRGAVYRSSESAGLVVGAGVDPEKAFDAAGNRKVGGIGGGVKARGTRELANDYHDDCHCVAEPVFYRREVRTISVRGYSREEPVLVPFAA